MDIRMLILLFMILPFRTMGQQIDDSRSKVKVVDGTKLVEVHPTSYEVSWPVFWNLTIPAEVIMAPSLYAACIRDFRTLTRIMKAKCETLRIYGDILEDIQSMERDHEMEEHKIQKRQVVVGAAMVGGAFVGSVVTKAFNYFFGDSPSLKQYVNQVCEMSRIRCQLIRRIIHLNQFAIELTKAVSTGFEQRDKRTTSFEDQLMEYVDAVRFEQRWASALASCRGNLIPHSLINTSMLKDQVMKVEETVAKDGYRLAVAGKSLSSLYKLQVAECVLTREGIFVVINLPLVRIESNWKVYEVLHLQFAFHGQTCQLYPSETSYLAKSGTQLAQIHGHLLHHCSVRENGICHIPIYDKESKESINCAVGMLTGSSLEELRKSCSYQCYDNSDLIIQQLRLSDKKLILTNAVNVTVECGKELRTYLFQRLGAVEVTLVCGCQLHVNGVRLMSMFPCMDQSDSKFSATVVLPLMMTNLNGSLTFYGDKYFSHVDSVYNENWMRLISVNNISKLNYGPDDFASDDSTFDSWLTRLWLYIISIVVGLLLLERILWYCVRFRNQLVPVIVAAQVNGAAGYQNIGDEIVAVSSLFVLILVLILAIWIAVILYKIHQSFSSRNVIQKVTNSPTENQIDEIGKVHELTQAELGMVNLESLEGESSNPKTIGLSTEVESLDNAKFSVPTGTFICIRRCGEYFPIVDTPLKPNIVVVFQKMQQIV